MVNIGRIKQYRSGNGRSTIEVIFGFLGKNNRGLESPEISYKVK